MEREREKIIEVKDLSFAYDKRLVLDKANLAVYRSDFLAVVGPNGSGKSTLIKLILGLLKPQKGKVYLLGKDVESFNQWHRVGYISQKATAFNPTFPATVREVVEAQTSAHLGIFKRMKRRQWEKVDAALEMVGLTDFRDSLVGKLSGGQQQKVMLARVLVTEPELMLLDEPMVGIDLESQESIYSLLTSLHKRHNLTVIMVTHDISSVIEKVNRLVCIHQHKIFEHDPLAYRGRMFKNGYLSQLYHLH